MWVDRVFPLVIVWLGVSTAFRPPQRIARANRGALLGPRPARTTELYFLKRLRNRFGGAEPERGLEDAEPSDDRGATEMTEVGDDPAKAAVLEVPVAEVEPEPPAAPVPPPAAPVPPPAAPVPPPAEVPPPAAVAPPPPAPVPPPAAPVPTPPPPPDSAAVRLAKLDLERERLRLQQEEERLRSEKATLQLEREYSLLGSQLREIEADVVRKLVDAFSGDAAGSTERLREALAKESYSVRVSTLVAIQSQASVAATEEENRMLLHLCYRLLLLLRDHDASRAATLRDELRARGAACGMAYLDEAEVRRCAESGASEPAFQQSIIEERFDAEDVVYRDIAGSAAAPPPAADTPPAPPAGDSDGGSPKGGGGGGGGADAGEAVAEAAEFAPSSDGIIDVGGAQSADAPAAVRPQDLETMEEDDLLPLWVPDALVDLRSMSALRSGEVPVLSEEDVKAVREALAPAFFVKEVDTSPFCAVIRGNLVSKVDSDRAVTAAAAAKLRAIFLTLPAARRLQMLVLPEPPTVAELERIDGQLAAGSFPFPEDDGEGLDGLRRRPSVVLVPRELCPQPDNLGTYALAVVSGFLGGFATLGFAIGCFALNKPIAQAAIDGDDLALTAIFPLFAALVAIQMAHEAGHRAAAAFWDVDLGPPVLLPSLQTGLYGAITPFTAFPPSRSAVADVAVAGPLAGIATSIAFVLAGLKGQVEATAAAGAAAAATAAAEVAAAAAATAPAAPSPDLAAAIGGVASKAAPLADSLLNFPVVPAAALHESLPVAALLALLDPTGQLLSRPVVDAIPVHPVLLAGITGVFVNALNLLPAGRLDGGRAVTAAFGRDAGKLVSLAALGIAAFVGLLAPETQGTVAGLGGNAQVLLFWGLLTVLWQRDPEVNALDEVTEPEGWRQALSAALVAFGILCLVPYPDTSGIMF